MAYPLLLTVGIVPVPAKAVIVKEDKSAFHTRKLLLLPLLMYRILPLEVPTIRLG